MKNSNLCTDIESLINYIEDNIEDKLTLELLSNVICLSKFHLIRVFKSITDITIMNYVRSRKLASSLNDLLKTDLRIIDIASKYNFEHEQTYIRSFRKEYGITPAKFRKNHTPVKIVDKINMNFCKQFEKGILFNPKFIVKPAFKVVGLKDKIIGYENITDNTANFRGVDFFYNHRHRVKNAINPNTYIGLTRLTHPDADYSFYMPSIQVSSFDDIPEDMSIDTVPSHKYAVFHYIGNHSPEEISIFTMLPLYEYIFDNWMLQFNYDLYVEGSFYFEVINADVASENYCEADIYYPLPL